MALSYKDSLSRYRKYLQLATTRPVWVAGLWVILSLILMIVLLIFALRPTLVTISGLLGQIKSQQETADKLEAKINSVQRAISELDGVEDQLYLLEEAIPTKYDWNSLTNSLQQAATESGITLESLIVNKIPLEAGETGAIKNQIPSQLPQGIIPVRFSLSGSGSYQQIQDLVVDLYRIRRLISITEVQIQKEKNKDGFGMTITGEAGYQP